MIVLKSLEVNESIFFKILDMFKANVIKTDDLRPYLCGYKNKNIIYYNDKDQLICREMLLDFILNKDLGSTYWKQVRLIKSTNTVFEIENSINGTHAWNYIIKLLKKYYTWEEINNLLKKYTAEYDENLKQYHFYWPVVDTKSVQVIDNTYKFDINGAHLDALCEIFPKAKNDFVKMYQKRKKNPSMKKYPNFFVGMLAHKEEYRTTYNWIVQRTTKMLKKAMKETGGMLVYANTDGFVVKDPTNIMTTNKNLGDFKLEFNGITYIYTDKNYILYQFDDELKGSCLEEVRKDIDLATGKIVHYDIKCDKDLGTRKAINITKETLPLCQ